MAFLEHKKLFEASRTFIDVLYIYTAIILHIIQRCCKPENCIKNYKTVYDMCYEHFFGYKYIYIYIYITLMLFADLMHVYSLFQLCAWLSKLS